MGPLALTGHADKLDPVDGQSMPHATEEVNMHASVHDKIIVHAPHIDGPNRDGEILDVRGPDGAPPYMVRWSDTGHEGLYFPGSDAVIQHIGAG